MINIQTKGIEPVVKTIGEFDFYIRPFPAFLAANISGELISVLSPVFGSLISFLSEASDDEEITAESVMDMDLSKTPLTVVQAFQTVDGTKLEKLMRTLLCNHRNISFCEKGSSEDLEPLDSSYIDKLFTGSIEDMFLLAIEVIKINYKGFFKRLGSRSGEQERLSSGKKDTKTTDILI